MSWEGSRHNVGCQIFHTEEQFVRHVEHKLLTDFPPHFKQCKLFMLFTQKNVIEIQQVVFHGFTLHNIRNSNNKKSNHLVLRWHSNASSDWRKTWDRQFPCKLTQAHSSTLRACQNLYNLAGLDNFLRPPLQPHPFHLRLQFSGHWLERSVVDLTFIATLVIYLDKTGLFRICNLSLQSSHLKPLIHYGLKKTLKQNAVFGNKETHSLLALLINLSDA